MLNEAYTAINYHNRSPNFSEEFKLRLPTKINKQTHLFFTFVHVHTKQKSDAPMDEVVGYTWLPLWRDDCLQTGTFALPVLADAPTAGYSFLTPCTDSLPNVKWIDNHKPLFVVHLDSYSSIFAQDAHVDRFFRITSSLDSQAHMASYLHSANFYEEFSRAISGLANANTDSLVKFVHLILNRLIQLMVRPPQIFSNQKSIPSSMKPLQTLIFETAILIVSKINSALYSDIFSEIRSGILSTFIHYQAVFPQPEVRFTSDNSYRYSGIMHGSTCHEPPNHSVDSGSRSFYEELLQQWLTASETVRDKLFDNANFFFDLLFKSMCIHLSLNGGFLLPPRKRLSKTFLLSLEELVRLIGEYVYGEVKRNSSRNSSQTSSPASPSAQARNRLPNLNQSFAFFIRDLLTVVDRNFVLSQLVKIYIRKLSSSMPLSTSSSTSTFNYTVAAEASMNAKNIGDSLFELRVDFLRVLSGYEHFVAINLPFGTPLFTALEQCLAEGSGNNAHVFSPSSSFAKAMLNSSIFSHSIFDRIRPYAELTDDYRRQHWPLGLVFCTLVDSFTRTKTHLQLRAANLLRSVMTSHDWDQRYKGRS